MAEAARVHPLMLNDLVVAIDGIGMGDATAGVCQAPTVMTHNIPGTLTTIAALSGG